MRWIQFINCPSWRRNDTIAKMYLSMTRYPTAITQIGWPKFLHKALKSPSWKEPKHRQHSPSVISSTISQDNEYCFICRRKKQKGWTTSSLRSNSDKLVYQSMYNTGTSPRAPDVSEPTPCNCLLHNKCSTNFCISLYWKGTLFEGDGCKHMINRFSEQALSIGILGEWIEDSSSGSLPDGISDQELGMKIWLWIGILGAVWHFISKSYNKFHRT